MNQTTRRVIIKPARNRTSRVSKQNRNRSVEGKLPEFDWKQKLLLAEFVEAATGPLKVEFSNFRGFIIALITDREDMSAVHAFRALSSVEEVSDTTLTELLGPTRIAKWRSLKWVSDEVKA